MATYKIRGTSHNVIYPYKDASGVSKQQWESYDTEAEAVQRKAYIDYLQDKKMAAEIRQAALDYKRKRAIEKSAEKIAKENPDIKELPTGESSNENLHRTFREFMERFLPICILRRPTAAGAVANGS